MKHFAHYTEANDTIYLAGYMSDIVTTKDMNEAFDFKSYTAAHLVATMLKQLDSDKTHNWAVYSKQ